MFTRVAGVWPEKANLLPDDGSPSDVFGWSVALDGDTVVIGARKDGDNGVNSGSAYVFRLLPCGDGILDPDEECDDGNNISCDGCSAICEHEMGFVCGDGGLNTDCGEECDDGNNEDGDGCSADCTLEEPVPAASYQGVLVLVLLLLTASMTVLLWRRRSAA